jgi:hypothetical protein
MGAVGKEIGGCDGGHYAVALKTVGMNVRLYTTWFVCAKELLAESERAVSEPQCHMADSDKDDDFRMQEHRFPFYCFLQTIIMSHTKIRPTMLRNRTNS